MRVVLDVRLQVVGADEWQLWRALRLRALEEAPHAFSAKLVSWQAAEEARWRERLSLAGSCNLVAFDGALSVGMVSGLLDAAAVSMSGMWVAPEARGRGVGDALVQALVAWARTTVAERLVLDVKATNVSAMRAYERNQFVKRGRQRNGDIRMVLRLADAGVLSRSS